MENACPIKDQESAPVTGAPNTKTPEAVDAAPGAETQENQQLNCVTDLDCARKNFLTLQARAAMAGYALHELANGYLLCRWDRARQLPDLLAVAAVLLQMGVRA